MKVSGTTNAWSSPSPATTPGEQAAATDFLALLAASGAEEATPPADATTATSPPATHDFTNMTRQQLRDWVNDEIRNGRMSLEDGGTFIGMTIKLPTPGQPEDDCPSDPTRFNYLQMMRDGIGGALWQHDQAAADRYRTALAQLQAAQSA